MQRIAPWLLIFLVSLLHGEEVPPVAGTEQVAEIIENYEGRGALADGSRPTPPEEALKQFRIRDGFEIELVASEPVIGQPLHLSWDSKGRMWVTQYLQYQFPAGLKIIEYDNHLRAQFDKVPEPPPHGVKGADKITVFEDTTGDGIYDSHRDVITGLNIATSVETGAGGIWVTNPPYLLFYPDADGDADPDSDPEVILSGFGIEDTHAVANSLKWGPDGWLYGVTGSTTTAAVENPATGELVEWQGQAVWRYHPTTKQFELYAEGGGNTFSLEIDSAGRVFSGTNNGKTRGMYYPQGAYGKKSWGKHGPLTNPYAFGYIDHMAHEGDERRFAQAFCIYEGGLFPDSWNRKIIAANSLHNIVWVSELLPDGSTFRTVDEEPLLETDDRWFRPVFCGVGPDGCVYLADWYDSRLSHVRPVDDWHKGSGRIYRIKPKGTMPKVAHGDLSEMSASEALSATKSPNWVVGKRAILEFDWMNPSKAELSALPDAQRWVEVSEDSITGYNWHLIQELLNDRGKHHEAIVSNMKSLGDADWDRFAKLLSGKEQGDLPPDVRKALIQMQSEMFDFGSEKIQPPEVSTPSLRAQVLSTAKRIPTKAAVNLIQSQITHDEDLTDPHIPLLLWWAIEAHAESGRTEIVALASDPETWNSALFRKFIAERLIRRYAMAGGEANYLSAAKLLQAAPDDDAKKRLMTGLQLAFQGTAIPELPDTLKAEMESYAETVGANDLVLQLQQGNPEALKKALAVVASSQSDPIERVELATLFGEIGDPSVVPVLLRLLGLDQESTLKRVALLSLANYDSESIATTILARHGSTLPAEHGVRSTAHRVLASRPEWAKLFLGKIDVAEIKARNVAPDVVQLLARHGDPEIDAGIKKHWPDQVAGSSSENDAEIARIRKAITGGTGNAEQGSLHFKTRCASCHQLFGEGRVIGPDLTGYERQNLEFWLPAIVDPGLELREGYINYVATMKDGRVAAGFMHEQAPNTVTLRDMAGQHLLLNRNEIGKLEASKVSLMPPGLLSGMSDEELRDLFAYLMKE